VKPITIIGGGLAGLALGIELRRRDVSVKVFEAGTYPRHRVCGEFISGRGADLLEQLVSVPGLRAGTAAFFAGTRSAGRHELPMAALCVSRFTLDAALAQEFRSCGGELRERERVTPSSDTEGVVFASGRRPQPVANGWRWFGLKVHVRGVRLDADLEMHLTTNGYVGLCRLPNDEVNVCGLFRRRDGTQHPVESLALRGESRSELRSPRERFYLEGRVARGSVLFSRLDSAQFIEDSFCAVAGLSLAPQPIDPHVCRIGDALTMIPPITGNGMSMAFESAHLAVEPLLGYARAKNSWTEATKEIAAQLRKTFTRRLRWASHLHRLLFSRGGAMALPWLFRAPPVWRTSFMLTR